MYAWHFISVVLVSSIPRTVHCYFARIFTAHVRKVYGLAQPHMIIETVNQNKSIDSLYHKVQHSVLSTMVLYTVRTSKFLSESMIARNMSALRI